MKILEGQDAYAHIAGQPINVMLYGDPGCQKTTDAFSLFANGGGVPFGVPCEDGAFKILASRGLPIPAQPDCTIKSWPQMQEVFAHLGQTRGRYSGLVLDGMTAFTSYLYNEGEALYKGSKNKFQVPLYVRQCLFMMREWIRMLGIHCVMICHAEPPAVQDGVAYPGGMKLSPRSLIREWYGQLDTVLRVGYLPSQIGQPPQRVYFTGGNDWPEALGPMSQPPDLRYWLTKNREGCSLAAVPADLGGFLRQRQPPYKGI